MGLWRLAALVYLYPKATVTGFVYGALVYSAESDLNVADSRSLLSHLDFDTKLIMVSARSRHKHRLLAWGTPHSN